MLGINYIPPKKVKKQESEEGLNLMPWQDDGKVEGFVDDECSSIH